MRAASTPRGCQLGVGLLALLWHQAVQCTAKIAEQSPRRVEVWNQAELVAALNNDTVDTVVFMPVPWNLVKEELPHHAATIRNRRVVLEEGTPLPDGKQVYIDGNRLTGRVLVTEGAEFIQRNFWVDDCIVDFMPFNCFAEVTGGNSRVTLEDVTWSDATCTKFNESDGFDAILYAAAYATKPENLTLLPLDVRSVVVQDTGWVPYVPPTAYWRLINVTLSCTGNVTHPLPTHRANWSWLIFLPVFLAISLYLGTARLWPTYELTVHVPGNEADACHIAKFKGYRMIELLGQGRFGKVYKAIEIATGRLVAVKVLVLQGSTWEQLRAAWQECQIMGRINHPYCVEMVTHYAARVTQALVIRRSWFTGRTWVEPRSDVVDYTAILDAIAGDDTERGLAIAIENGLVTPVAAPAGALQAAAAGDQGEAGGAANPAADLLVLQVHLVMELADQGSLADAVQQGRFNLAGGGPDMPVIIETMGDVARFLSLLHGPDHHTVHGDLTPHNVLLRRDMGSPRDFRALVADFGLSLVLSLDGTHLTSDMRGTLSYMAPEVFSAQIVSTELDIYSFGVMMYFVLFNTDPFRSCTPHALILRKLGHEEEQFPIPSWAAFSNDPVIRAYLHLMARCTLRDRHSRPGADEVLAELNAMLG